MRSNASAVKPRLRDRSPQEFDCGPPEEDALLPRPWDGRITTHRNGSFEPFDAHFSLSINNLEGNSPTSGIKG